METALQKKGFSPYHLKCILVLLFSDEEYRDRFFPVLKPEHFNSDKYLYVIAKAFWLFYERYGVFPDVNTFFEEVFNQQGRNIDLFNSTPSSEHIALLAECFMSLQEVGEPPADYISDITLKVIKLASIHTILSKNRSELVAGTINVDSLAQEIMDAANVVESSNIGVNALVNLEKRTEQRLTYDPVKNVIPLVIPGISEYIEDGGVPRGTLNFFLASTGIGKCLAPTTPVIMYDGSFKKAKDVLIGDLLLGPDSRPRKVFSTTCGKAPMYRIIPTKGIPFECNDVHVLTLVDTVTDKVVDIPLNEYLLKNTTFKHRHKLFIPSGVDFPWIPRLNIDPYFLGAWFGDGTKNLDNSAPCITTMDKEIVDACKHVASMYRLRVHKVVDKRGNKSARYDIVGTAGKENPLTSYLKKIVGENYTIPQSIKVGSPETRMQFLAGIIDTDGSLSSNCFDIIQKRKDYAEDICFIARSLGGLTAHVKECKKASQNGTEGIYYRVVISGDTHNIPVRLPHKKASYRLQKKNVLRTGFKVIPLGIGDYSGFTINEDGRFLLGDFTVTHNTTALITLTKTAVLHNKKTLYISAELSDYEIFKRFDAAMTGIRKSDVRIKADEVRNTLLNNARYKAALGNLQVVEVPMGMVTVRDVESIIKSLHKRHWEPDLLVVDYADNLAPIRAVANMPRMELHGIYRDLRGLGQRYNMGVWTASQTNDMGTAASEDEKQILSVRHANEARAKTHVADIIIGIARTAEEKRNNEARLVLLKNRFGGHEAEVVKIFPDFDCSLMWTNNVMSLGQSSASQGFGAPSDEGIIQASIFDNAIKEIEVAEGVLGAPEI